MKSLRSNVKAIDPVEGAQREKSKVSAVPVVWSVGQ